MQESEHYLIDLVTGLVKEYVQEEDCLIMLAMTMKGLFSFLFHGKSLDCDYANSRELLYRRRSESVCRTSSSRVWRREDYW